MNQWVRPRITKDLDCTVAADAEALERVDGEMRRAGFAATRIEGEGAPSGPDFLRYWRASTKDIVELQSAKTDFQGSVLGRAQALGLALPLPVATPEDLVVLKLIANRSHDWADLVQIGAIPGLDWAYIARTGRSPRSPSGAHPGADQLTEVAARIARLRRPARAAGWQMRPGRPASVTCLLACDRLCCAIPRTWHASSNARKRR